MQINKNNDVLKDLLIKRHSGELKEDELIIIVKKIMEELSASCNLLVGFRKGKAHSKEFFLMNDEDGPGECFAVYTDMQEYKKWDYSDIIEPIEITFLDLVYYIVFEKNAKGVIINPFSEDFVIDYEILEYIAESSLTKQNDIFLYNGNVGIDNYIDHVSDNIENRLYELASIYNGINKVWVRSLHLSVEQVGLFLFDLNDNSNIDFDVVTNDIALSACCHKVIILDPNTLLSKELMKGCKPLYTKSSALKS